MSVILDALRKAQEERKRADGRLTDGDELLPRHRTPRLYYVLGAALFVLMVVLFIPDLHHLLRLGTRTDRTPPPLVHQAPKVTGPAVVTESTTPVGQKAAGNTRLEIAKENVGVSEQASKENRFPRISWAPSIQIAVPPAQGQVSRGMLSAPEPKPPSTGLDQAQSIVVKTADVKDSATEMYNKALQEMEHGRAEDARRSYLAVLADRPDDAEALNNLGVIAMNEGNISDAFSYFKMALDCRPDYPKAHNNLGMLYLKEGQNRSAEEQLRQALKLDPDGIEPYLNLSALLRSEGRFQEASQLLAVLVQKGRKGPIIFLSWAIINDEMGNYPEAIAYYRQYVGQGIQGAERNTVAERLKILEGLKEKR